MIDPCQILLVSDGKGTVTLFKDGKPCTSLFNCKDRIDPYLELWLEKSLISDPLNDQAEELPF